MGQGRTSRWTSHRSLGHRRGCESLKEILCRDFDVDQELKECKLGCDVEQVIGKHSDFFNIEEGRILKEPPKPASTEAQQKGKKRGAPATGPAGPGKKRRGKGHVVVVTLPSPSPPPPPVLPPPHRKRPEVDMFKRLTLVERADAERVHEIVRHDIRNLTNQDSGRYLELMAKAYPWSPMPQKVIDDWRLENRKGTTLLMRFVQSYSEWWESAKNKPDDYGDTICLTVATTPWRLRSGTGSPKLQPFLESPPMPILVKGSERAPAENLFLRSI